MTSSASATLEQSKKRVSLKDHLRSFDPEHVLTENKGFVGLDLTHYIRKAYENKVETKTQAFQPFISFLIGNPIRLTEQQKQYILDDVSSFTRRSTTASVIHGKINTVRDADIIRHSNNLPSIRYTALECRISGVCSFCDLIAAAAHVMNVTLYCAYKGFGVGYGHALVSGGKTPLSQAPIPGVVLTRDMGDFGIFPEDYTVVVNMDTVMGEPKAKVPLLPTPVSTDQAKTMDEQMDDEVASILQRYVPHLGRSEKVAQKASPKRTFKQKAASHCAKEPPRQATSSNFEFEYQPTSPTPGTKRSRDGSEINAPSDMPSSSQRSRTDQARVDSVLSSVKEATERSTSLAKSWLVFVDDDHEV